MDSEIWAISFVAIALTFVIIIFIGKRNKKK